MGVAESVEDRKRARPSLRVSPKTTDCRKIEQRIGVLGSWLLPHIYALNAEIDVTILTEVKVAVRTSDAPTIARDGSRGADLCGVSKSAGWEPDICVCVRARGGHCDQRNDARARQEADLHRFSP